MFLIDNTKIQNSKIIDVKNRHYADLDFQFSTGFENDSSNFKLLLNNVENTLYGFTNQGNITFAKVDFSFISKETQTVSLEIYKDGEKILEDSIEVTADITGGSGGAEKIVCEVVAVKTISPYDIDKVTSIQNPAKTENAKNFIFKNCQIDTSKLTSAKGLFYGVTDLEELPQIETGNCTNSQEFAQSCTQLKSVPMLDTSKVTNFKNAFYYCKALTSVPALNLENATTLYGAFDNCISLTSVPAFDTKNCTDFTNVLQYCSKLEKAPKMDWGKATVCSYAFRNCTALTEVPEMNTSVCNKFNYVFYGCTKLQKIEKINFSSATDLSSAFGSCSALTSIDFEGEIPISVSFSSSSKLEASQLVNIMEHLKDLSGSSSQTLTLGSVNLAKLTDSEKAIALNKNWILA